MILYSGGDEHCAAAGAVVDAEIAADDHTYAYMGNAPHPDNIKESYSQHLASLIKCQLIVEAKPDANNQTILDNARAFVEANKHKQIFVLVGWSTWEREVWEFDNQQYPIQFALRDKLPHQLRAKYKKFVETVDVKAKTKVQHKMIWEFHEELLEANIPHLFFNTYDTYQNVRHKKWGDNYVAPYKKDETFWNNSINNNFKTNANEKYFGYLLKADAHHKWALQLLPHIAKLL